MTEQWSPPDRAIYGAEDDEDMNMILDYLERAVAAPEANDGRITQGRPKHIREDDDPGALTSQET